eukprot:2643019-Alexandrium_andersonii.AAC.1
MAMRSRAARALRTVPHASSHSSSGMRSSTTLTTPVACARDGPVRYDLSLWPSWSRPFCAQCWSTGCKMSAGIPWSAS